jgi:mycothiol synthase
MFSNIVSPVEPRELLPALRLLVGAGPQQELRAEQCRAAFEAGDYKSDGLFVTHDASGSLNGAALVQTMPGALGVAWPPRGESAEIEDALTQTACNWLKHCGVKVCQAFASTEERLAMAPLERNGFSHVTQLVFLQRDVVPEDVPGEPSELLVQCKPWLGLPTPEQREVLLATHEEALDCPELNDARTSDEVINGYFRNDPGSCSWWLRMDGREKPVGVMLFDKSPEPSFLELSYFGLVPAVRGKGLGSMSLTYANRIACNSGYRAMSVSVDARNEPALRLYRRHGFVETNRHDVFLAAWAQRGARGEGQGET